jgi:hypothetical protein
MVLERVQHGDVNGRILTSTDTWVGSAVTVKVK